MNTTVKLAGTCSPEEAAKVGGVVLEDSVEVPLSYINEIANDDKFVVLVSEVVRPGVQLFTTKVEHTLFPPENPEANACFQLGVYEWEACQGMPYILVAVPAIAMPYIRQIAQDCGLMITKNVLLTFGLGVQEEFPIKGTSLYKLENLPGSAVYANALDTEGGFTGYQQRIRKLLKEEQEQVLSFLKESGAITQEE